MSVHESETMPDKPSAIFLFCAACDKNGQEGSFGFSPDGAYEHTMNMGKKHMLFTTAKIELDYAAGMGWTKR